MNLMMTVSIACLDSCKSDADVLLVACTCFYDATEYDLSSCASIFLLTFFPFWLIA